MNIAGLLLGWKGYAAAAVIAGLMGAIAAGGLAWELRGWKDAFAIATAETAAAKADTRAEQYNTRAAQADATMKEYARAYEAKRATANENALNTIINQGKTIDGLRGTITRERAAAVAESDRLRMELKNADPSEVREVGPVVLRYLDRVRDRQNARGNATTAAGAAPGR